MTRAPSNNSRDPFFFVHLIVMGLVAARLVFDHPKYWGTRVSVADPLSTMYLSVHSSYRWMTKLWCEGSEFWRLCYHHPEESNLRGYPFSRETLRQLNKLQIFEHITRYVDPEMFLKENDPVFLTAADSDYYPSVKVTIRSVQEHFPKKNIIFYDLGLEDEEAREVKSFCNVEYMRFPFEDFPGYFRALKQYRWKPVIIAKTLASHGAVWYMDSSIIFLSSNVSTVYNLFSRELNPSNSERKFSFLLHHSAHHGIYSTTSPLSYLFIPTNLTKMKLLRPTSMVANLMLIFRSREAIESILMWLLACALERDCMSTPEARLLCKFTSDPYNDYANCHRYDQAIINLLLANHLGYKSDRWTSGMSHFFDTRRHQSNATYHPYFCTKSNVQRIH